MSLPISDEIIESLIPYVVDIEINTPPHYDGRVPDVVRYIPSPELIITVNIPGGITFDQNVINSFFTRFKILTWAGSKPQQFKGVVRVEVLELFAQKLSKHNPVFYSILYG